MNSTKVLEKYFISLLGLEKSLKFSTLSNFFFCMSNILLLFLYFNMYLRCNCKSYPIILQSVIAEGSINRFMMAEEVKIVNDSMTCFSQLSVQEGVKQCRFLKIILSP